ncbi:carbamoyl-phosphate synthase L chain, ATP binding domain-containing protein [Chytridium lagenaria]|nr:carbamoyl-phosphate synthase L chain, ATP binding domain-containing protein [Chytridium lagenaria]
MTVQRLLVANRGEIAIRVMRTCRKLGIRTIAVFSDSDSDAEHVKYADEAIHIGASAPSESYLDMNKILMAAKNRQRYGFLSENADFADAVRANGIIFIGPQSSSIRAIGDKISSKQLLSKLAPSVPLVPGYNGDEQGIEHLTKEATRIGFPVLIKASAGGGGKGMRIVHEAKNLAEELQAAQGEAKRSFGDSRLLIEKYIVSSKHIEVQIFGDKFGNYTHCYERECSAQRRHQKIIEETPSVFLTEALRSEIVRSALTVASVIGYENAGTVEFIVDTKTKKFYFLEVNTRLQVEHPITEMITGLDLVEMQIGVAYGKSLKDLIGSGEPARKGHSIECRICAEDPDNEFSPSIGTIKRFKPTGLPGIRYDGGIADGSSITVHYDSLITKVIVHAPTREDCIALMKYALSSTVLLGIRSNIGFLVTLLQEPNFVDGSYDTALLGKLMPTWKPALPNVEDVAIVAFLMGWSLRHSIRKFYGVKSSFRNMPVKTQITALNYGGKDINVVYEPKTIASNKFGVKSTFGVSIENGATHDVELRNIAISDAAAGYQTGDIAVSIDGKVATYSVVNDTTDLHLKHLSKLYIHSTTWNGEVAEVYVRDRLYSSKGGDETGDRTLITPMPCKVLSVNFPSGSTINVGDAILTVESMKMETKIRAKVAGVVTVNVKEGDIVQAGVIVAKIV